MQVLVTPHTAFLTVEALENIAATTVQNLDQVGAPCLCVCARVCVRVYEGGFRVLWVSVS